MPNTISCAAIKCYFRSYKHDYTVKKMYFADIIKLHHDQLGVYGSPAAMAVAGPPPKTIFQTDLRVYFLLPAHQYIDRIDNKIIKP